MSGAVDFAQWAAPDLVLTLGERTYPIAPPSVEQAKKIIALAVRSELNSKSVQGELPDALAEIIDSIEPLERPAFGPVIDQMIADEVPVETIDRMHYYAVFYWARGKEYADAMAVAYWAPRGENTEGGDEPAPKAQTRSRRKSGRGTA